MFSKVRYYSFKVGPDGDKVPGVWLLLAVLIIVLLALDPPVMGMLLGMRLCGIRSAYHHCRSSQLETQTAPEESLERKIEPDIGLVRFS